MATNSPASTNGANLSAEENLRDIRTVEIPLDIDQELVSFLAQEEQKQLQVLGLFPTLPLKTADLPVQSVQLNRLTGSLTPQSASTAYNHYKAEMIGMGLNFRPYHHWLAMALPAARSWDERISQLEMKVTTSGQTTA